jgi:hypothetical protein
MEPERDETLGRLLLAVDVPPTIDTILDGVRERVGADQDARVTRLPQRAPGVHHGGTRLRLVMVAAVIVAAAVGIGKLVTRGGPAGDSACAAVVRWHGTTYIGHGAAVQESALGRPVSDVRVPLCNDSTVLGTKATGGSVPAYELAKASPRIEIAVGNSPVVYVSEGFFPIAATYPLRTPLLPATCPARERPLRIAGVVVGSPGLDLLPVMSSSGRQLLVRVDRSSKLVNATIVEGAAYFPRGTDVRIVAARCRMPGTGPLLVARIDVRLR